MKTIAVFGASGNTGKLFTEMALKDGYAVKALVRTPAKLGLQHPNLQIIQGDLTDSAKVEETIRGTDAVISLIGAASGSPNDTYRVGHLVIDAGSRVTRTDLAAFVLDELQNAKYVRQMPLVSN